MGTAGADVDFLQEFQRLCVEQVDGRTMAEGHPDPPTGPDHVVDVAAGVAVGLEPLWWSVMVKLKVNIHSQRTNQ